MGSPAALSIGSHSNIRRVTTRPIGTPLASQKQTEVSASFSRGPLNCRYFVAGANYMRDAELCCLQDLTGQAIFQDRKLKATRKGTYRT